MTQLGLSYLSPVNEILYTVAESHRDLYSILKLQQKNLASSVSREEALEQGFVTVEHDFELLKRMNTPFPHVIAKASDEVIGYTLVMLPHMRYEIPVLEAMFDQIDNMMYKGHLLSNTRYFIMGQVCISKDYRGLGVFKGLYHEMADRMTADFDYIVTEISLGNLRSINAHQKVGFETIKEYRAEDGEDWLIALWEI